MRAYLVPTGGGLRVTRSIQASDTYHPGALISADLVDTESLAVRPSKPSVLRDDEFACGLCGGDGWHVLGCRGAG